jgi:hypothetical protein
LDRAFDYKGRVAFHNLCTEISAALCDFSVNSVVKFRLRKTHHRVHGEVTEKTQSIKFDTTPKGNSIFRKTFKYQALNSSLRRGAKLERRTAKIKSKTLVSHRLKISLKYFFPVNVFSLDNRRKFILKQ